MFYERTQNILLWERNLTGFNKRMADLEVSIKEMYRKE